MNFNWAEMKKEHKQAALLVGMWLVGGLFALYQFVIHPFLTDRGESVGELDELRTLILKAQMAMSGETKVRSEYTEAMKLYRDVGDRFIVPDNNPLAWVQDKIYSAAQDAGISIQSVSPVGGAAPPAWEALMKAGRIYRPYAVRVATEGSYPQIIAMVGALERSNPYLAVVGITVSAQDLTKVRHAVNFIVEWPMWGNRPNLETGSGAKSGGGSAKAGGTTPAQKKKAPAQKPVEEE